MPNITRFENSDGVIDIEDLPNQTISVRMVYHTNAKNQIRELLEFSEQNQDLLETDDSVKNMPLQQGILNTLFYYELRASATSDKMTLFDYSIEEQPDINSNLAQKTCYYWYDGTGQPKTDRLSVINVQDKYYDATSDLYTWKSVSQDLKLGGIKLQQQYIASKCGSAAQLKNDHLLLSGLRLHHIVHTLPQTKFMDVVQRVRYQTDNRIVLNDIRNLIIRLCPRAGHSIAMAPKIVKFTFPVLRLRL